MAEGRIAILLRAMDRAWSDAGDEGWHPPLAAAIDGMTAAEAAWQAVPGALTAWQFTRHVAFWKEVAGHRLAGRPRAATESDNDATFGAPGDGADEAGWRATVARLAAAHAGLRERVAAMRDDDLTDAERERLVLGMISHDAYHAAEIVQLRKLQGGWPVRR